MSSFTETNEAKMNLFIEPTDVWLFRTGRPFAAQDQSRAASIFPPTPRTVQGALRSARLGQSGASFAHHQQWPAALQAEIGRPDDFGALQVRGPLLAKRKGRSQQLRRFFPLPADVTKLNTGWHILAPQQRADFIANWQGKLWPLLPPLESEPEKFAGGWFCEHGLQSYLAGRVAAKHIHPAAQLFDREPRTGVQIESRAKRPTEGNLYQVEFMRLAADVGLLVEAQGLNLQTTGWLQLGGEARSGSYAQVLTGLDLPAGQRLPHNTPLRFKLYLATPALFNSGWLPQAFTLQSDGTYQGTWRGLPLKLMAAALGKTQAIGGRDIARGDVQRAMYRAVPAGSVYFFEVTDTNHRAQQVLDAFDGKCVSDIDNIIGFGLGYVGGWQ